MCVGGCMHVVNKWYSRDSLKLDVNELLMGKE